MAKTLNYDEELMALDDEYARHVEIQRLAKGNKSSLEKLSKIISYTPEKVYTTNPGAGDKTDEEKIKDDFLGKNGNGDDGGGDDTPKIDDPPKDGGAPGSPDVNPDVNQDLQNLINEQQKQINILNQNQQYNQLLNQQRSQGQAQLNQALINAGNPQVTQMLSQMGGYQGDDPRFLGQQQGKGEEPEIGRDYTARHRRRLEQQMEPSQRPRWWPTEMPWPPTTVLGRDAAGYPVLGVDWDIVFDTAKSLGKDISGMAMADASAAKRTQAEIVASDPSLQANPWNMTIPGTNASLPVMRSADGSIQEIDIPTLDRQIDRAIIDGDAGRARTLIGIRDAPSSQEKMSLALQIARSPADVYQLGEMAAGKSMERFGQMAPYLQEAVTGVFGQDPFQGLRPQGAGESLESLRGRIPQPSMAPDQATTQRTDINKRTPQGGMSGQAGTPTQPTARMGLGGTFIQEAPSDITGAALEDWYERDAYERRPKVGAPGQVAPIPGPTAGMTYEQKIAAGRGDLYGTSNEYMIDPDAEFAARYQSPQYIAEQAEIQRLNDIVNKYSFAGVGLPDTAPSPAPASQQSGGPLTTPGVVDTTMGANATKTNPVTASIQQAMGDRGYFLGNAGTSSPGMPQYFIDPEQEQNMLLPTQFSGGMPSRVQNTLVEGHSTPAPHSLLSQVGLRTPSMQSYRNWLPEEIQVAERALEMRGLDKSRLWESVKYGTPGVAQNRAHWVDAFRD